MLLARFKGSLVGGMVGWCLVLEAGKREIYVWPS